MLSVGVCSDGVSTLRDWLEDVTYDDHHDDDVSSATKSDDIKHSPLLKLQDIRGPLSTLE
jgi:hypothetical protein